MLVAVDQTVPLGWAPVEYHEYLCAELLPVPCIPDGTVLPISWQVRATCRFLAPPNGMPRIPRGSAKRKVMRWPRMQRRAKATEPPVRWIEERQAMMRQAVLGDAPLHWSRAVSRGFALGMFRSF